MYKSVLSTFLSISFLCVFFCQKNIIEKAARKMLIISPIGNFIKILQAALLLISLRQKISKPNCN